jgi:hypothetical protein
VQAEPASVTFIADRLTLRFIISMGFRTGSEPPANEFSIAHGFIGNRRWSL